MWLVAIRLLRQRCLAMHLGHGGCCRRLKAGYEQPTAEVSQLGVYLRLAAVSLPVECKSGCMRSSSDRAATSAE